MIRAALLLLLLAVGTASAQRLDAAAERRRIADERLAAHQAFRAREAECRRRFAVNTCVEQARADQREVLDRLRREQTLLDEMQRRERAAQRMQAIRTQTERQEALPPAGPQRRGAAEVPGIAASAAGPSTRLRVRPAAAGTSSPASAASAAAAERALEEARSRARFEERQREAARRRELAERRAAERGPERPAAASLPLPR